MSRNRFDFQSRIAFRPVVAGTLLTIALTLFLSTSVKEMFEVLDVSPGEPASFRVWFTMASVWGVSLLAGSVIAALAARAMNATDAILNAVTVWALSFLVFGVLIAAKSVGFETIVEIEELSGIWVIRNFFGEVLAFVLSVLGAVLAARWNGHSYANRDERHPVKLAKPALGGL